MSDVITIPSRSGSLTFDFDNQKLIYDRGGTIAETAGLLPMVINMNEITDIELRTPTFMKLGGCNIIVNGIRYVTANKPFDMTQFSPNSKPEFALLESALKRILVANNLSGFKADQSVNAPKKVYEGPQDDAIYKFTNNTNSTLRVYEDYIIIKHSGVLNVLSKSGGKGEKRINYNAISAIEYKKASTVAAGVIQFSLYGSDVGRGNLAAAADENSIMFDATKNQITQEIVDYIEKRRTEISKPQATQIVQATSPAEELKKFKELLDMGIITQEEFDAKKKQLLGL